MFRILQIVAILVVSVAMALALAHALELPGKLRLSREQYLAVQPIYYPGFTVGGIAEPVALVLMLILLSSLPLHSAAFSLTAAALAALVAMHATYWLLTHPVNNFWLKDVKPTGLGARFFAAAPFDRPDDSSSWTRLRDQWEYSHVLRAGLGLASLALLVAAVVS